MKPNPRALVVALLLDLLLGEPTDRWHPVAWIGRALRAAERRVGARTTVAGAASVLAVAAGAAAAAAGLGRAVRRLGGAGVLLEACALKPAFAIRRLAAAAGEVEAALRAADLAEARRRVGRHRVSRHTADLGPGEVASAAVESVAENLADSVVAPLVAYGVGGLPAAWAYRVVNTADALWGYRDGRHERFGKPAARLDDALNFLPARLAAAAVVGGAALAREDARAAAVVAWRQHGRTASPNAGWPMAAMAGALGLGLAKRGAYRLGEGPLPAAPAAIARARRVFAGAAALGAAGALVLALLHAR